jgi:hypothetical protein
LRSPGGLDVRRPMLIPIIGVIVIAALVYFLMLQRKKASR